MADERPKLSLRKPGEKAADSESPSLSSPGSGGLQKPGGDSPSLSLRKPGAAGAEPTVSSPVDGEAPTIDSPTEPEAKPRLTPPELPMKSDAPPPVEEEEPQQPASKGKFAALSALDPAKKKKFMIIAGAVVGVVVLGLVAMAFMGGEKKPVEVVETEEPKEEFVEDEFFGDSGEELEFADGEDDAESGVTAEYGLGEHAMRIDAGARSSIQVNVLDGIDTEFMLEFWAKFVGLSQDSAFHLKGGADDRFRLSVRTKETGREVELFFADSPNKPILTQAPNDEEWLHLAFAVSVGATNVSRIYVNGSHMVSESNADQIALLAETMLFELDAAEGHVLLDDIRVSNEIVHQDSHFLPRRELVGLVSTSAFLRFEPLEDKGSIEDPGRKLNLPIEDVIWENIAADLDQQAKAAQDIRLPYHVLQRLQQEWPEDEVDKFLRLWNEMNNEERRHELDVAGQLLQ